MVTGVDRQRATGPTITIVPSTGLDNQTSEHGVDSNETISRSRRHLLRRLSSEFDYVGLGQVEELPTGIQALISWDRLWPRPNPLRGKPRHRQRAAGKPHRPAHESPDGMGIAHGVDSVYWYNDGYYGELVRYDFKPTMTQGEHDHSDGIVQRYSGVQINRWPVFPATGPRQGLGCSLHRRPAANRCCG